MRVHQYLLAASITCLLSPLAVLAEEIDYPNPDDQLSPCGVTLSDHEINQLPTPKAIQVGDTSYISGGSCSDSVRQIKGVAKSFPLEIILVEKEENKEVYIADVKVTITDDKNNDILNVITEGAFLLINPPDGQYKITAEYNLVSQSKFVKVNHKEHKRMVFLWGNETKGNLKSE